MFGPGEKKRVWYKLEQLKLLGKITQSQYWLQQLKHRQTVQLFMKRKDVPRSPVNNVFLYCAGNLALEPSSALDTQLDRTKPLTLFLR